MSGDYGRTIGIKARYKWEVYYFFYAHLDSSSVKKNDKVTAGELIGVTGNSGNAKNQKSYMNHLHFEVRRKSGRGNKSGQRINPEGVIAELSSANHSPDKGRQV